MHGALLVPIILGSDKTTISVATGQNEYWPSMLELATFIIMSGVHMELGLFLLAFYPYPKVSPFFFPCCYCLGPLTFFCQLTRVKLRPLSSNSFGTSYSMSPCHLYWNQFVLVKRHPRSVDVLMDIIKM